MKRDIGIDLLKVLAILGVIIIHTCSFTYPIASSEWTMNLLFRSLAGASVPLFLMASGAVMLKSEKTLSLKKLFFKNILRIFIAMLFWAMAYKIYHLIGAGNFNIPSLFHALKEVLLFNQEFHFYYIHIILLVYLFLPITRIIIKNASKRELEYLLILWFLTAIIYPTIKPFWPINLFGGMLPQWAMNMTYASIGYGILGYYLKKYPIPAWIDVLYAVSGFFIIFYATYAASEKSGYLYEHFLSGMGAGACFLAVGIFSLVNRVKISGEGTKNAVSWLSKSTFLIYLVHMLVMYELKRHGFMAGAPVILQIPVIALTDMGISIIIYLILSKIPVINKWII